MAYGFDNSKEKIGLRPRHWINGNIKYVSASASFTSGGSSIASADFHASGSTEPEDAQTYLWGSDHIIVRISATDTPSTGTFPFVYISVFGGIDADLEQDGASQTIGEYRAMSSGDLWAFFTIIIKNVDGELKLQCIKNAGTYSGDMKVDVQITGYRYE